MKYHRIVEERSGYAFVEFTGDPTRATVVRIDRNKGQVYSAMPRDLPPEGGEFFGRISDAGISYVAALYSRGYARRRFRQLVIAAEERQEDLRLDALVSAGAGS